MITVQEVQALLERNKVRLQKELFESKEALFLLRKSTQTKLTPKEKQKVQMQLLDICKAIPAFTVFLLPGGTLLLALLIKLIPNILPSAYREDSFK